MSKTLTRFLIASCLIGGIAPAHAASEQDIAGWLSKTVPVVLTNDPAQPGMMDSKRAFFTTEGFNGFTLTMQRDGALQQARQVEAVCVTQARMQEGGTWIVDTQVVYKNPHTVMEPMQEAADKSAPPKAKPNPYSYETAQFYIKDVATASEVKISQYIPDPAPKEGFGGCRAPGEVQHRASTIDEQLAFYESTLATLNERIASLRAQKAALTGGAPLPPQAVPPAPQQLAPVPMTTPGQAPQQQPALQPIQAAPAPMAAPTAAPVPLQPAPQAQGVSSVPQSIDSRASEHILRAPAGAVPVTPTQPVPAPTGATMQVAPSVSTTNTSNYARPYQGGIQENR